MRFMVIVKASAESEAGVMPDAKVLADMGKFNEELIEAGVMLAGEGLHPSSKGLRVKLSGKKMTVTDGPFAEAKELIAGFWLWRVESREEVLRWLEKCPRPPAGEPPFELEVRQVFEEEDFGKELVDQVPEVFEAERKFRARTQP
jgi:hypothetical protein